MKLGNLRALLSSRFLDLLTIGVVAAFLFPYVFMVSSAFKTRLDTFAYPPISGDSRRRWTISRIFSAI